MTPYELLDGGIAALAEDVDDGLRVHGVILGEGDTTTGLSGKRTRWPADVLQEMVGMLEGKPITMADSLDPEQHVGVEKTDDGARPTGAISLDEKVGEITASAYEDGVGLLFEGFLSDWEAEDVVERGLAQVSPVLFRELELVEGEEGDPDALYEATEVAQFRDLAIVADGAAPSNEIEAGPAADLPAAAEALTSHFDVEVEALADGGLEVTPGGDDGHNGGDGQSTPANGTRTTMDELSDRQRELLAAAGQKDDPTVVEAGVPERLSELEEQIDEHDDLIAAADDLEDPAVESEEELAAMQERVGIVEEMMAEALTEEKGLREATVEAMSFEAMAAEFETDDGDLDVEALVQQPETGDVDVETEGGPDALADLDDAAREEVEAAKQRYEHWEGKNDTIVEAEKETIVEALGVDSFDDVDLEAI